MADDLDTLLAAARLAAAARGDDQARAFAEQRMAQIATGLDVGELAARALASGAADPGDMKGLYGEMGGWGETVAASVAAEEGWVPIHHAIKSGQTGIDVALFNPETDEIRVLEVKTTATDAPFRTSNTQHGRQTSPGWLDRNLPRAGLENASAADVSVRGAQVNARTGKVSWQEPVDQSRSRWREASQAPDANRPASPDPLRQPPGPPAAGAAYGGSGGKVIPGDKRVPAGDRRFA